MPGLGPTTDLRDVDSPELAAAADHGVVGPGLHFHHLSPSSGAHSLKTFSAKLSSSSRCWGIGFVIEPSRYTVWLRPSRSRTQLTPWRLASPLIRWMTSRRFTSVVYPALDAQV